MREKQQVNTSQTELERTKPAKTGLKRKQEAERSERVRSSIKRGLEMTEKKTHSGATPDGGWGWMIVAGCFLTTVCTRAVTRSVHDSPQTRGYICTSLLTRNQGDTLTSPLFCHIKVLILFLESTRIGF